LIDEMRERERERGVHNIQIQIRFSDPFICKTTDI